MELENFQISCLRVSGLGAMLGCWLVIFDMMLEQWKSQAAKIQDDTGRGSIGRRET